MILVNACRKQELTKIAPTQGPGCGSGAAERGARLLDSAKHASEAHVVIKFKGGVTLGGAVRAIVIVIDERAQMSPDTLRQVLRLRPGHPWRQQLLAGQHLVGVIVVVVAVLLRDIEISVAVLVRGRRVAAIGQWRSYVVGQWRRVAGPSWKEEE
jgi:hypothetical protein